MFLRLFFLFLFFGILAADEYPKIFEKLGTPLFESSKKLSTKFSICKDINALHVENEKFQTKVFLAKENGKLADKTQDKKAIKNYLFELRALQKNYDFLLHLIHKEILKSIDTNAYNEFIKLISIELSDLLENENIKKKAIEFYKKNKTKKTSQFLEKKIKDEALLEVTMQEFHEEVIESNFSSDTKQNRAQKSVSIYATRVKNKIQIYFLNTNPYDVTLNVQAKYENFEIKQNVPQEFSLKAKSTIKYATLELTQDEGSYNFSFAWIMGNKDAVHDDNFVYRLPYAKGNEHIVSQSYNGKLSHKGNSRYAIDFAMNTGTKVYAARNGLVVRVKSDSNQGGYDRKFSQDGNFITILHKDGTFGIYYHLQRNGVTVRVGENIKKAHILDTQETRDTQAVLIFILLFIKP